MENGKELLKGGFPFLITGAIYIINSKTDVLMLSKLSDTESVALYDAANGLILVLLIIPSLLSQALYPFLSQQFSSRSNKMAYILNFVQWILSSISVPIAIGIVILADSFIIFFYGADYSESAGVLKIMGFGLPIVFMRSIFGWVLASINKVNMMMWTNLIGFVLNAILNAILISKYNSFGAALATTISNVIATFIVMQVVRKQIPQSKTILFYYMKPAIPGICLALFLLKYQNNMNIYMLVMFGAVIYTVIYYGLLVLCRSEELKIVHKYIVFNKR